MPIPVRICWSEKDCSSLRLMGAEVDFRRPSRMMVAERRMERMLVIMKERRVWGVGVSREERRIGRRGTYACACYSCVGVCRLGDGGTVERHGGVFALLCSGGCGGVEEV